MMQSLPIHKARVPALALGALALAALGVTALPRLSSPAAAPEKIVVQLPSASFAQRPIVAPQKADSSACGAGAYVSGDIAGDASPAAVYTAMCGGRP
jgi:hypothetical protein